jgi:hypothetical protein
MRQVAGPRQGRPLPTAGRKTGGQGAELRPRPTRPRSVCTGGARRRVDSRWCRSGSALLRGFHSRPLAPPLDNRRVSPDDRFIVGRIAQEVVTTFTAATAPSFRDRVIGPGEGLSDRRRHVFRLGDERSARAGPVRGDGAKRSPLQVRRSRLDGGPIVLGPRRVEFYTRKLRRRGLGNRLWPSWCPSILHTDCRAPTVRRWGAAFSKPRVGKPKETISFARRADTSGRRTRTTRNTESSTSRPASDSSRHE